ncbi:MAG: c-type cytochrome [Terriglobia bacterium]
MPFSVGRPTVIFPGYDGGAEWGGPAVDPSTRVLYVNSNDVAWTGELAKNTYQAGTGQGMYLSRCGMCHGDKMAGSPPDFPSLIGVGQRLSAAKIKRIIRQGRGKDAKFSRSF